MQGSDTPLDELDQSAFIARLTRLVLEDAAQNRRVVEQIWARPLSERVEAGRAIADVRIVQQTPDGLLTLTCPRNESRFREGDVLCLHRNGPATEPRLLVTLEADDDEELLVSTDDPSLLVAEHPSDGWMLDEGLLDFSAPLLDAIAQTADTAVGRERVLPVLQGQRKSLVDDPRYNDAEQRAEAWGLNEQQIEAVAYAYASDLVYLIQGPPGTGKTLALACLAILLAEAGERVLITAFTHRAIHNALNMIARQSARFGLSVSAVKIGRRIRTDDLLIENYDAFDSSPLAGLSGGYIVGATPFATGSRRLRGVEFDHVIFDEASQITLPLAMMGMRVAPRYTFIGDHRQLPPVVTSRYSDQTLRDSVFAALVDHYDGTLLEETYRLNDELTAWPSTTFYDERLRPAPGVGARRIVYTTPPVRFSAILDPYESKVFVDMHMLNTRTFCRQEAELAADLVCELLACGIPAAEIGIVTPYRAQARRIRRRLRELFPDQTDVRRAIVSDTVERMQGQEREVVIISLTTADPIFATELADFFFQPERMNVAITRPRTKLIMLGSSTVLHAAPAERRYQEWVELFQDLINQCAHRPIA